MASSEESVKAVPCTVHGPFFGEVSLPMLIEKLSVCNVRYVPSGNRAFTWFVPVALGDNLDRVLRNGIRERTLFLCHEDACRDLLERDASCCCVVRVKEGSDCSWTEQQPFSGRVVVIESDMSFFMLTAGLQRLFSETLIWESKMDHFALRNRNKPQFEELVELSQRHLGNFICVTDNAYNVIVQSSAEQFGEDAAPYGDFAKQGCFSAEEVAFVVERVVPIAKPHAQLVICSPDECHPHTTFHYPIFIDGTYLFHVVMVCAHGSIECLRDMFAKFISRFAISCKDYWRTTVETTEPWRRLFTAYIERAPIDKEFRAAQVLAIQLPDIAQLRVLVYQFEEWASLAFRSDVLKAAHRLNGGASLPFMYRNKLVVVCYTSEADESRLAGDVLSASAYEVICEPYGLVCGMSQRIYSLDDLSYGYHQAESALAYRKVYEAEQALYGIESEGSVPFDFTLKYYLLDPDHDKELARFSFEHNLFVRIVEEDRRKGTNVANMVVSLIGNGMNGTQASRALHVHRNTILYHVSRTEKRYGISFKHPLTSQRVMLDYHYYLNYVVTHPDAGFLD